MKLPTIKQTPDDEARILAATISMFIRATLLDEGHTIASAWDIFQRTIAIAQQGIDHVESVTGRKGDPWEAGTVMRPDGTFNA